MTTDRPFADRSEDDLVVLDRLGHPSNDLGLEGVVVAPGLPEASRVRLAELGDLELTDDLDRIGDARLVLVSTRIPRAELAALVDRVRDAACPVVAVAHTGGERSAVEVVRRGGVAVVAEGNEAGIAALLTGDEAGIGLLESYDRSVARADTTTHGSRGRDPVTALPDRTSLDVRLASLEQEGEVPRIGYVRVVRAPQVPEDLGEEAALLVRRRLATQFHHVARMHDTELFSLGGWDFAVVSTTLSPNGAQYLARDLDRVAETYAPAGTATLGVALGHAGSEVSVEVDALREAAQRALDAAVADRSVVVVGADTLSLGMSATTELEAALRIVEHVERVAGMPEGHGARVGEYAAMIATAMGYDGMARSRIQLAGHLHGVGLASLPAQALHDPASLSGELRQAHRAHPARAATYLQVSAGADVAETVRSHCERPDGTGFPDGLTGDQIPIGARIVAAAHALEDVLHPAHGGHHRHDEVVAALQSHAGHAVDADVAAVAVEVLDELLATSLARAV